MELNKLNYQIIEQSEQTIKDGYFVDNDITERHSFCLLKSLWLFD